MQTILSKKYQSPIRLVLVVAVIIFVAESLVMVLLRIFSPPSALIEVLLDSSLLIVLISPALYYFIFRPFMCHIVEHQRVEDRLNYLAYYDDLTGLPNSTLFNDRLNQALFLAKRDGYLIAVLFLNLDRLKLINESLGYQTGDRLLSEVGKRLEQNLRESDSIAHLSESVLTETVARFGGDEFIILLPKIKNAQQAATVARRIKGIMSEPVSITNHQLFITHSAGISLYPADADSSEVLIKNAAAAMSRTKEQGGNNFQFYSSEINAKIFERLTIENELRQALERRQLFLCYQPQINLKTGQIVGMEALLRWHHPDLGMVLPNQFIPIAEETGLIIPIGKWALQTALAQNKAWQDSGLPAITMAVNLSTRQLQEKNLVEILGHIIKETNIDPHHVELELTESIMQNAEETLHILNKFRAMGVNISIDDFGTGYSSLTYLRYFPIQKLKIDQSFVRDCLNNLNDRVLVRTMIILGHALKIKVIAEGVETEEQLEFLRSENCDEMQGYLFSKPLSTEDATNLLTEKRCLQTPTV